MKNRASLTAQGIAVLRAVESAEPPAHRLFDDPYAARFVGPALLWASKFFIRTGYAEWRGPGVTGYLMARTRYIDDYLLASVQEGVRQVVILGAGFDARAYRFRDQLAEIRVFEVDHPATQAAKIAKLRAIVGAVPDHVTYVPIDFNTGSLEERLPAAGYDSSLRTLFIWEGVTMYISAEAVDATLTFIAGNSAPASRVIFDYDYKGVIEGTIKRGEASGMRRYQAITGESLVFGLAPDEVEPFLGARGFEHVVNATAPDLERLYYSEGPHTGRRVAPVYGIATAEVHR